MKLKSNQKRWLFKLPARMQKLLSRGSPGQVAVEYMMVIIILIAPMALEVLFTKLGGIMGRPYP